MRSAAVIAVEPAMLHDRRMRWTAVLGSVAINAALLALMALVSAPTVEVRPRSPIEISLVAPIDMPTPPATAGGGSQGAAELQREAPHLERQRAAHIEPPRRVEPNHIEPQPSPWADVDIRYDDATTAAAHDDANPSSNETGNEIAAGLGSELGDGIGHGTGIGNGIGTGIGDGVGDGIGTRRGLGSRGDLRDIAALPVPVPSKARPAKLLHPTRETEVDDAELFVAIVTVDTDGDVVGARMTRSHPGSRGDTAASMIWQFRYSPALDDDGHPARSTFEQPFAVR